MKTEEELKKDCTSDVINKMCRLAEGFENVDEYYINFGKDITTSTMHIFTWPIFPLLIHRAVEGWNEKKLGYIRIFEDVIILQRKTDKNSSYFYFKDYQREYLSHAECAMLDCLLEILNEEK